MIKYLMALVLAFAFAVAVFGSVNAQSLTPTVAPTSVPAGAPSTGHGTMAR